MATTITNNLKQISGPVLTSANNEFWFSKMKTFLQLKKCWDMVETEFTECDATALAAMNNSHKNVLEDRRDQDLTTKWVIQSCIEESIFPRI